MTRAANGTAAIAALTRDADPGKKQSSTSTSSVAEMTRSRPSNSAPDAVRIESTTNTGSGPIRTSSEMLSSAAAESGRSDAETDQEITHEPRAGHRGGRDGIDDAIVGRRSQRFPGEPAHRGHDNEQHGSNEQREQREDGGKADHEETSPSRTLGLVADAASRIAASMHGMARFAGSTMRCSVIDSGDSPNRTAATTAVTRAWVRWRPSR